MKKTYLIAAAALIAVPAVALAHEHGEHRGKGRHGDMMERLDTNKDGNLSADEARASGEARLKRLDANSDGVVTPDEAPRLFERPDADGDGKITAAELGNVAAAKLMRADKDGDGVVTQAERDAARDAMKERRKAWHEHHDEDEAQP
ncbi:MAG: hypothetical protein IT548_16715 [Alphaproteobacteria bacterium]|nr:hypothetical protein [Alphaproteobacteria bacterium]